VGGDIAYLHAKKDLPGVVGAGIGETRYEETYYQYDVGSFGVELGVKMMRQS